LKRKFKCLIKQSIEVGGGEFGGPEFGGRDSIDQRVMEILGDEMPPELRDEPSHSSSVEDGREKRGLFMY
jgi:hypothetical protein